MQTIASLGPGYFTYKKGKESRAGGRARPNKRVPHACHQVHQIAFLPHHPCQTQSLANSGALPGRMYRGGLMIPSEIECSGSCTIPISTHLPDNVEVPGGQGSVCCVHFHYTSARHRGAQEVSHLNKKMSF